MGFNKDAIFIGYNDFGSGGGAATIVAINKADAIAGRSDHQRHPPRFLQFRAMPPAQMHGDTTGGTEWFVSTDRRTPAATRCAVTELTDYLSSTPTFTLHVAACRQPSAPPFEADQPGGHLDDLPQHDDHPGAVP